MKSTYIWAVIAGMGVVNFLLRYVPIAWLSRLKLPRPIERWLSFIPVSAMSALVVGEVLRPDGTWLPPLHNPYLFAAVPTAVIYYKWRSFLGTTVAGIVFFLVFRALLG